MASKKAAGSTKNGRDSQSKRLGSQMFWRTKCPIRNYYRPPTRNPILCRSKCEYGSGPHNFFQNYRQSKV